MRQFVSSSMPDSNGRIILSTKEHRYLSRVLRLEDGSYIDVRLPGGSLIQMKLHTGKTESVLETLLSSETDREYKERDFPLQSGPQKEIGINTETGKPKPTGQNPQQFWLFQFLPKVQKTDLIVRQAAECGISRIVPIRGVYSPPYTPRIERWQRIIREARQQSGSPIETEINDVLSAKEAALLWKKTVSETPSLAFILCEREEGHKSLFTHIREAEKIRDKVKASDAYSIFFTALAVGCEGGISPAERNGLEQSGFVPIHFKTNILRAETAALYGLAAIQNALTEHTVWKSNE